MASRWRGALTAALLLIAWPWAANARAECRAADGAILGQARGPAAAYLDGAFRRRELPAAAAIVVHDGAPGFLGVGRTSDGRPVSADTPVYIGSMSKAFTAAAVLQLAERGLVALDAPVTDYVGDFRPADPRAARITVRQLLNQTSGLSVATDHEWRRPQPETLKDAVLRLHGAGLAADPGTRFSYHNPNYAVLARLVETVSGESFPAYLRRHIFVPLGMTRTRTVDRVDEGRDGAARGHVHALGRYYPVSSPAYFVNGAGGVLTTPRDYARWLLAQLDAEQPPAARRVLSAAALRASHTPGPNAQEYGFGWNRRGARISHSGGLPNHASYVAMEGCDAVAVFSPVAPVAAPLRDIALGAMSTLKGDAPALPERDRSSWLDGALAILSLGALLLAGRSVARARRWAATRRGRPARIAAGLLPSAAALAVILVGLPWAASRVISWSWVWLGFYAPLWVVALAAIAVAAAATLAARSLALAAPGPRTPGPAPDLPPRR